MLVAVHTSRLSCREAEKAPIFTPVQESSGESKPRTLMSKHASGAKTHTPPPVWTCGRDDYSDGGVRLQPNGFEVPNDFALLFAPNEPARSGRYKVVWRLGRDVGAKFIGP